jgi:hypothetical protein
MSRAMTLRSGRNWAVPALTRRASAPCSAISAASTLPASCSCCDGGVQRLLDLGQQALVAVARELLHHGFERRLLALRFGQLRLEHAGLGLQRRQRLLVLAGQRCAPRRKPRRPPPGGGPLLLQFGHRACAYRPTASRRVASAASATPHGRLAQRRRLLQPVGAGRDFSSCCDRFHSCRSKCASRPASRPSSPGPVGTTPGSKPRPAPVRRCAAWATNSGFALSAMPARRPRRPSPAGCAAPRCW